MRVCPAATAGQQELVRLAACTIVREASVPNPQPARTEAHGGEGACLRKGASMDKAGGAPHESAARHARGQLALRCGHLQLYRTSGGVDPPREEHAQHGGKPLVAARPRTRCSSPSPRLCREDPHSVVCGARTSRAG
ncbi:hypothetical protein HWV62_44303 [Athelia sp. TMB]|nr:hypothetical protein HWV62_44303 [Athelia sp. TMB]